MTFLDTPPRQTEKQFMAQVIELAKLRGWAHYHTHRSEHSEAGFPDLVLTRRPRVRAGGVHLAAESSVGISHPCPLR